jgi:O-acetyl-ADP-ribose deacetylase (regulator of RNase III)
MLFFNILVWGLLEEPGTGIIAPGVIHVRFQFRDKVVEVIRGDITKVEVDALVNAANEGLRGGGGVDGAIHRAAGPAVMEECRLIGHCPTGMAVITTAGRLPAKRIIHTVGPVWHGGARGEAGLLKSAYENSLRLAGDHRMKSIAFPSISTGVYGYPIEEAAPVAIKAVLDILERGTSLERVVFVLFSESDYAIYLAKVEEMLGSS